MDILKARKKAAEQKRSRKKTEPEPAAEPQRPQEETAYPAEPRADSHPVADKNAGLPGMSEPAAEAPVEEPASSDSKGEEAQEEIDLLSFRLGGESYALLVKDVREVLKVRSLTPVPNAPSYIIGVTGLRGAVLPVIDLCARFGLVPGVRDEKSRIIVVGSSEEDVGLVVDRVTGVLRIMPDEIRPTPEHVEQGAAFLRGIVRKDEKLYILLDLEKAVAA